MSSFDVQLDASRVIGWADLLGTLPKPLAVLVEKLEAVQAVEPEPLPDTTKVTKGNASDVIHDLAADLAAQQQFHTAKNRVADDLARSVVHAAGELAETVRDSLVPAFDAAVKVFTEALRELGDNGHSPAALIAAGPAAVQAFHTAMDAQADIQRMESWVGSLASLPRYVTSPDPVCRITRPTNRAELQALENARGGAGELNTLYLKAIELGVPLALNLPDEAMEIRAVIEAQPVVKRPLQYANVSR